MDKVKAFLSHFGEILETPEEFDLYQQASAELDAFQAELEAVKAELKNNRETMAFMIEQFTKRDLEQQIKALEELSESLITNSIANHWCEKEQAGYFWCHDGITKRINQLKQQAEADDEG